MARRDPPASAGRLASVLGPPGAGTGRPGFAGEWPPGAATRPIDDRATEPLPAVRSAAHDPPTSRLVGERSAGSDDADPFDELLPHQRSSRGIGSRSRLGGLLRRLIPTGWRGSRVDPGRPGATALALVAAAAAVVAAVGVWMERPRAEPLSTLPAVAVVADDATAAPSGPVAGSAPPAQQEPSRLVVSVSGKVLRPGLVEVPGGSRVADVLEAAGGALPGTDLAAVNLARRVADGEQIAVGVPAAPDAGPVTSDGGEPAGTAAQAAPGGKVDLNAATGTQLDALPGVGPVTAQRILEWRTRNGSFARVEQLREVDGIGERRFAQLRELVTV